VPESLFRTAATHSANTPFDTGQMAPRFCAGIYTFRYTAYATSLYGVMRNYEQLDPAMGIGDGVGSLVERFVEAQDSDGEQADSQEGHGEHLGPEDLHAHTFQIGATEHDQKIA